ECRASAGVCDVEEYCSGTSTLCPADNFQPLGTSCSDGNFCNGAETCNEGICISGIAVDCAANDVLAVSSCNNNPDGNPLTWDFRDSFASSCDEISDSCTLGSTDITHSCSISSCGAECDEQNACLDKCSGNLKYAGGICDYANSCACSYDVENCDLQDGWYDTGSSRWINFEQCKQKEQKAQESRDYSCSFALSVSCTYIITRNKWVDTGVIRNKQQGSSCNDALWCSGTDKCDGLGNCIQATERCLPYNNAEIATCRNNPDNNRYTWDYLPAFKSQCDETNRICTRSSYQMTHICDTANCNAVCIAGDKQSEVCGPAQIGECKQGIHTRECTPSCVWGSWSECAGAAYPAKEICDAKDNDCDGSIDEGFDSDKDGVPDCADRCLNTPKRTAIDSVGCSAEQFCNLINTLNPTGLAQCPLADWKSNEPNSPNDCHVITVKKGRLSETRCSAAPDAN
ncbi:MAG: hypothetical protein NTV63_03240, partial [Candidatus Woesearchaeota archaeon]|nr:hypothetical protein [Candidatus Woesearchaeota archaeon]